MEDLKPDEWGKCATCGFLAVAFYGDAAANPIVFEAHRRARGSGNLFAAILPATSQVRDALPLCTRDVPRLREQVVEITTSIGQSHTEDRARRFRPALEEDWQCSEWYPYSPGLDPSEHLWERGMTDAARRMKEYLDGLEESRRLSQMWAEIRMTILTVLGIGIAAGSLYFGQQQVRLAREAMAVDPKPVRVELAPVAAPDLTLPPTKPLP